VTGKYRILDTLLTGIYRILDTLVTGIYWILDTIDMYIGYWIL